VNRPPDVIHPFLAFNRILEKALDDPAAKVAGA
jgi:hypothetical protein